MIAVIAHVLQNAVFQSAQSLRLLSDGDSVTEHDD
jgi:hypothetical protein